ncbi:MULTISPECIES: 2-hydroxyacid dehydrogenase [unclassified Streptomyces]|uniref:2-hydroxyacid dehydrogenase n=1 Tax=unclassified Streptomyces TaxID=2593676 RepID=UPI00343BB587
MSLMDGPADPSAARFLLPYPASQVDGLPEGLPVAVWDGTGGPPSIESLEAVEFFVIPYTFADAAAAVLPSLQRLRVVQSLSAGVDDLLQYVPSSAVLCNARGVHDASTAELAVSLALASLRGIPDFARAQDAEEWRTGFRPALADRTVLLVGYGSIAAAVEDRLTPFECEVLRVARTARTTARGAVHALTDLPELLLRADIVMLTVPLTQDTRGLVDERFLALMPDGALLVNVSRGAVVDTDALLAELGTGRLSAALDVTEPEPLPQGHPLWHAPNTLISPHVGGNSSAFLPRALRLIRAQLLRYLAGEPLENIVLPRKP